MKKSHCWKKLACLLGMAVLVLSQSLPVSAKSIPYDSYNYDYREYIRYTPAAYRPVGNVDIADYMFNGSPVGKLLSPQDLCADSKGCIYVADTGNNRIVVMDEAMTRIEDVIDSFLNQGEEDGFNQPSGVCISEKGQIYVADSQNRRVVVLEKDHTLARIIANPQSESLEDGFVFTPLKLTVDYADRLYVIAQNMFEGIMVFEENGKFSTFFGTIDVEISLWDKFWKRMATKEERSKQKLYIPTEFTGLDTDSKGFVYATNLDANGIQGVRRLNPSGVDVIKKGQNLNLGGDLQTAGTTEYAGPSQFADVTYRENGIYSCLDRKRGRIFTYDHEGNLLYVFGGLGTQDGTFRLPVAIEEVNGKILVLDGTLCEIQTFEVTEYGRLINEATALRYDGDEVSAVGIWERVLELDENNELAHVGIGKAYLTAGDYKQAMKHLRIGMAREYYSVAYRRYRNEMLRKGASAFLSGIVILAIALLAARRFRKKERRR